MEIILEISINNNSKWWSSWWWWVESLIFFFFNGFSDVPDVSFFCLFRGQPQLFNPFFFFFFYNQMSIGCLLGFFSTTQQSSFVDNQPSYQCKKKSPSFNSLIQKKINKKNLVSRKLFFSLTSITCIQRNFLFFFVFVRFFFWCLYTNFQISNYHLPKFSFSFRSIGIIQSNGWWWWWWWLHDLEFDLHKVWFGRKFYYLYYHQKFFFCYI